MRKAFRASRLMGPCGIVLGLMAFGTTAAQAEVGAFWSVNKEALKPHNPVTDELKVQLQASMENLNGVKHGMLLTKIGLTTVAILCTAIKLADMLLRILGAALGKVHFEGCRTLLNGVENAACKPKSPGAASGLIETEFLTALIKLHTLGTGAKVDLVKLSPENAELRFVTLEYGAECAIGSKANITGHVYLKDFAEKGLTELKEHLVVEGPLTELKYGNNALTLDGNINVFPIGAHTGFFFSGLAQ